MGLTIAEIRDRTVRARHLMQRSRNQHFAVGAFNIDNQETLQAICQAAKNLQAPVLVEVSDGECDYLGGMENVRDMVSNYIDLYGVEMYINLDHAPTVESCKRAIDAGFEFIHIDVSQANHDASEEEIIAATKEVVEYAKFTGALVESEPHYFGGSSAIHTEDIDYEEIKKPLARPNTPKNLWRGQALTPLPLQWVICTVNTRCQKCSTLNCCSAYAMLLTARLVYMVVAIRHYTFLKMRPKLA